jgi:hypothetical protein
MSTRRKIQLLFWVYFWLIIFEGAIRKWLLPGLSTPLLVIRDPIAMAALPASSLGFLIELCRKIGAKRVFEFGSGRNTQTFLGAGFPLHRSG